MSVEEFTNSSRYVSTQFLQHVDVAHHALGLLCITFCTVDTEDEPFSMVFIRQPKPSTPSFRCKRKSGTLIPELRSVDLTVPSCYVEALHIAHRKYN